MIIYQSYEGDVGAFGRNNIKMTMKEMLCQNVDWVYLPLDMVQYEAFLSTGVTNSSSRSFFYRVAG